jgi:ArsR family transcriptional regulator
MDDRPAKTSADAVVHALRAAAEPTRLRILALCARGELTVSELVHILGQSQPRVSRHLRLLVDGGLMERFREGSWVFHRVVHEGPMAAWRATVLARLDPEDASLAPHCPPGRGKGGTGRVAQAYFRRNAAEWDRLRASRRRPRGRTAESSNCCPSPGWARCSTSAPAPPASSSCWPPGWTAARASTCRARCWPWPAQPGAGRPRPLRGAPGHMYELPFEEGAFDVVTIHQVLHFADEPAG